MKVRINALGHTLPRELYFIELTYYIRLQLGTTEYKEITLTHACTFYDFVDRIVIRHFKNDQTEHRHLSIWYIGHTNYKESVTLIICYIKIYCIWSLRLCLVNNSTSQMFSLDFTCKYRWKAWSLIYIFHARLFKLYSLENF